MIASNIVGLLGAACIVAATVGLAGPLWALLVLGLILVAVAFALWRNAFVEAGK